MGTHSEPLLFYTLDLPEGWQLTSSLGAAHLYKQSGDAPESGSGTEDQLLVINLLKPVPDVVHHLERHAFAAEVTKGEPSILLGNLDHTKVEVRESRSVTIDGREAILAYGIARDVEREDDVAFQMCYIFADLTTIFLFAVQTATFGCEEFEKVAMSFSFN